MRWSTLSARPLFFRVPIRPRVPRRRCMTSGARLRRWRRFWSEPLEVGKSDLDQGPDRLLEPGFARRLECLGVALPDPGGVDSLLQAVVPGKQELLNPL